MQGGRHIYGSGLYSHHLTVKNASAAERAFTSADSERFDVSSITDIIKTMMASEDNTAYRVYAVVAPAIAGQFKYAKPGQIISAIKELGFYRVWEAGSRR